jgi:hypothetical protein
VFPVRYELNSYNLFRRILFFKVKSIYRLTEFMGFRTSSIVRILKNWKIKTRRFGDWICFRPQVRRLREEHDSHLLGSVVLARFLPTISGYAGYRRIDAMHS